MIKRLALAVGLLVLVGSAFALWLHHATASRINAEAYEQIQVGMTRQHVEDVLGGPPRSEVGWLKAYGMNPSGGIWEGQDVVIYVWYDTKMNVSAKRFSPAQRRPSWWDRVRSWLP
jgi:hypothetical protein